MGWGRSWDIWGLGRRDVEKQSPQQGRVLEGYRGFPRDVPGAGSIVNKGQSVPDKVPVTWLLPHTLCSTAATGWSLQRQSQAWDFLL